jgi:chromosomal replication initiation ATPase DnaA
LASSIWAAAQDGLNLPAQLVLPLVTDPSFGREDFIVSPANAEAVAFIDAYPNWAAPMAALHGPSGSGKTHLARAWAARAQAHVLDAAVLDDAVVAASLPAGPLAVENVDDSLPATRDSALFTLTERGTALLFTGREPPVRWPVHLPDLASRFRALLAFPLWAPDDGMLAALAQKLFLDRQLRVPDQVIVRMIESLERSPGAIRDFVAKLDARALAEKRGITLALLREMLPSEP